MRFSPTNPFPAGHPESMIHRKGFSDWIELDPIKGIKDFNKGITSGDLDRLATPPMIKDAGRPSVAWNYLRATYDPSKPYSFGSDTKRNANAVVKSGVEVNKEAGTVTVHPVSSAERARQYLVKKQAQGGAGTTLLGQ